jgi:hypothetical protein
MSQKILEILILFFLYITLFRREYCASEKLLITTLNAD